MSVGDKVVTERSDGTQALKLEGLCIRSERRALLR